MNPDLKAMAEGIFSLLGDPDFGGDLARRPKARVEQELSYGAFKKKWVTFHKLLEATIGSSEP